MILKIKKINENARIPSYANPGDAGLDLFAVSCDSTLNYIEFGTGLSVEIEDGNVGLLFPRSSISKTGHRLLNSVGVIDSSYRGEIKIRLSHTELNKYKIGDKIAQLLIMELPKVIIKEVDSLNDSQRGDGGFGSTD